MATRAIVPDKVVRNTHTWSWEGLLNGDDGAPISPSHSGGAFSDKTVHVFGTPGVGGTLVIEGSNDGINYSTLNDPSGSPLSFSAAGIQAILENPLYIRPNVTGGDGSTDFDVIIVGRANMHYQ